MIDTIIYEENQNLSRTAMMEGGRLAELDIFDRNRAAEGDIYLSKIVHKLELANGKSGFFLDIGDGHDAFLNAEESGLNEANFTEGQSIVVQVSQEKRAEKGAKVIRALQFVGNYIVYCPFQMNVTASSKVTDIAKLDEYKHLVKENMGAQEGWILRTNSIEVDFSEIKKEMETLHKIYDEVRQKARSAKAPVLLFSRENRLQEHINRNLSGIRKIIVNNHNVEKSLMEKFEGKLEVEYAKSPFDDFNLEDEIEDALLPTVTLKNGGRITIEETKAFVAIDVDSGSDNGAGKATALNTEAAIEIARQIRLRNLSGKIIVDFAGSSDYKLIKPIIDVLNEEFKKDYTKTNVLGLSKAGNIEILRVRRRPSLRDSLADDRNN